jgi:hypothetical protein
MVTEFFLGVIAGIVDWFLGLFPEWVVPAELVSFDDTLNGFIGSFSGLGVWVPWALLVVCVGIAIASYLVGLAVRAGRWILGLAPTMGGGT